MNCGKCGKTMPNGARFCIACGAEHDANGQLITKNAPVDYNKTMMANDSFVQANRNQKVDYNKTVMANDLQRPSNMEYNKTMMANDLPQSSGVQNNNWNNSASNASNINTKQKSTKKKISPVFIVVPILLVVAIAVKLALPTANKEKTVVVDGIVEETSTVQEEVLETGNLVLDFDVSDGYWTEDAEFFIKNGTKQINQWKGDYYLGEDGRKVRNELIDDTYYVDASGKKMKNQWYRFTKEVDGEEKVVWYYMGSDGAKLVDTYTPDGYYVDEDGVYIPGMISDAPDSDKYVE